MKKMISKVITVTLLASVVACSEKLDTVSGETNAVAYMDKANSIVVIPKSNEGGETTIEPRLSGVATQETKITVAVTDYLEQYNKENGTLYKMLPLTEFEMYEDSNPTNKSTNGTLSVTVKEGTYSSKIKIRIKPLNEDTYPVGVRYVVPVRIISTTAKDILANKDVIVSLNRPFKTSVVELKQGNNFSVQLDPNIETTSEFTVQGQFMFLNWKSISYNWNQSLINFRGGNGANWWYTRVNPDSFQVKDLDADGDATLIKREINLGTWYQISFVYRDNNLKVYINGELAKTFVRPNLSIVKGEKAAITVGNTSNYSSRDFRIREVRVWNRALSDAEITDGLYLPVNPESKGLLVYLPIDEKNGFKDLTKYNNEVNLYQDGKKGFVTEKELKYEWTKNVKFPSKDNKLEIEP